jgi:hypothetical protein
MHKPYLPILGASSPVQTTNDCRITASDVAAAICIDRDAIIAKLASQFGCPLINSKQQEASGETNGATKIYVSSWSRHGLPSVTITFTSATSACVIPMVICTHQVRINIDPSC